MVHLTYIDNPFQEDIFNSISFFSYEKDFYDCINRKFLDIGFEHLENTFYTYLLTGDSGEWIGYVLFSNEHRVHGLYRSAYNKILEILDNNYIGDIDINIIKDRLKTCLSSSSFLKQVDEVLVKLSNYIDTDIIEEYYNSLQEFLVCYPDYFYLDVVIGLPLDEKNKLLAENPNSLLNPNLLVEAKYYGFIQEVLSQVDGLIKSDFNNIPVFLREDDYNVFLINDKFNSENSQVKQLVQ